MSHTPGMSKPNIKLFLDGADKAQIAEFGPMGGVAGFTTNPSLMRKAGVTAYKPYCLELTRLVHGKSISFEVFADTIDEMKSQALVIQSWGKEVEGSNIYVKIPVMNTQRASTAGLVRELSHAGVKLNVTAIFTVEQTRAICDALKGGAPAIVSVFAGRLADQGVDPLPLMRECAALCRSAGSSVELLWASTREAYNVVQAAEVGCQIITAPGDMIKKALSFGSKDAETLSWETVKTFKTDSDAAGFTL